MANELWPVFQKNHVLSSNQLMQFKRYVELLSEWNVKMNITRITSPDDIIQYHFEDSLVIDRFIDIASRTGLVDVGTGGGFPGIPLAIKYPQLPVILIEVNLKKVAFLQAVITELGLENIEICSLDWRTFLRKTEYNLDLFCSRASLHPDELVRMFSPTCRYRHATLVYWASVLWQPEGPEREFVQAQESYVVGDKQRKYVFFALPEAIEQV